MKSPISSRIKTIASAIVAAVLGAGVCAGCNYVGAAFLLAHGPPKIPGQYALNPNAKTVILIDDLSNRVPRRSLRDLIGKSADETLLSEGVIAQGMLISSESARRAAASDSSENRMSAVEVGRRVGADVIIYVTMTGWTLQREPGIVSPAASADVKVIDCVSNQRMWPPGDAGYDFLAEMPRRQGDLESMGSQADKSKTDADLAKYVGIQLARLFFTHERDTLRQQEGTEKKY